MLCYNNGGSGVNYLYNFNAHGDVVETINGTDGTISGYQYDAYGNVLSQGADTNNPFGYFGQYHDKETGMIYLRARYYEPNVGRFVSEDPIRSSDNWYNYTDNNPVNRWDTSGKAWTEQDQAEYDRLMKAGKKKEAKNFKKAIEEATEDYNDAGDDIYKQNEARYKAVQARQGVYANGYVDNYDYMHGNKVLIFVGTHNVAGLGNHAGIIIMVAADNGNYPEATNNVWGGKVKYTTLGAGEQNGNATGDLIARTNRGDDVDLNNKNGMILVRTSQTDADNLITSHNNFMRNHNGEVNYGATMTKGSDTYNSNSYARGLLAAAGVAAPTLPWSWWFPGWDKPIPGNFFQ